jgi:TolB-like protein/DNA-binding winged helix-turn-helix (wHTH) protein/Flp pilus assembly protein TadD
MERSCHVRETGLTSERTEQRQLTGTDNRLTSRLLVRSKVLQSGCLGVVVQNSTSLPPTLRFGVFELDPRAGELRKKGVKVRLQGQPVEILVMLLERPGETITREELQKKLWPADTFVDFGQGLNNAMKRLRAALDDDAESPHFIETLPRHGYRFIGSVDGAKQISLEEARPVRSAGAVIRLPALAALAVVALIPVLVGLNVRGWRNLLFSGAPKPKIQALAVLPLANLSGDPEQEYFADGMTESLITELGKINSPRVISRQSIMQYKGSKKGLPEIARELNVDAVLEGAVVHSGDRVKITVHLAQVSPERQLWTQEYDRSIRDVLSLQGEIARAITDEIQVKLTPEERTRLAASRPVNPEAQDDYLRGLYFGSKWTELSLQTAIAHFERAIEKDPTYAPAYAELAMAYFWLGNPEQGGPSARETMPQARAAVTKALQLDPSLARAHLALGLVVLNSEWNWSGAENQYRLALKLNPNCGECHTAYGVLLRGLGRNDEAIVHINRAIELDPLSSGYREALAAIAFSSRQYDLAIKQCENLNGDDSAILVGLSYAQKNMYPEAIANLEMGIARSGRETSNLGYLGQVYGLAGRKSDTRKIIGELRERSRHHYVFPSVFASAYLGLGDRDQALMYLERAYEEKDPWLFYLKVWPPLDPLRSEPRFQTLMRRVNLAQ